ASNQIGIDLLGVADNAAHGTSPFVSSNDLGDVDVGGNNQLNFPVINSLNMTCDTISFRGVSRPGATMEFYLSAVDTSTYGEGKTFVYSAVEGSAADLDGATGSDTEPPT